MYKVTNPLNWLDESVVETSGRKYTFRLLKSISVFPEKIIDEIKVVVQDAHEDAKRRLRSLAGINLDPLGEPPVFDPAANYPECLDFQTLKGYFGEIFAGIVSVNYPHFGDNGWEMPVSLFRFHDLAFDQIERLHQDAGAAKRIPGRTGDDNMAFLRDKNGAITKVLICEAKCTADHSSTLISDAHEKISESNFKPVSLRNLIDILQGYDDDESKKWVDALRQYFLSPKSSAPERYDLVSYACGRGPVSASRKSWIPSDRPHIKYTGKRRLEAVEIHLFQVDKLILEVYRKQEQEVENEPA